MIHNAPKALRYSAGLAAALMLAAAPSAYAQNLLIRGGTIHTGDETRPTAEVVAVRDGRIAYVGAASGATSSLNSSMRTRSRDSPRRPSRPAMHACSPSRSESPPPYSA